jgi:hypothetical protein
MKTESSPNISGREEEEEKEREKKAQISNAIKIRPVGAQLFHADRQTDGHGKANNRFCNFGKAPKN